MKFDITLITRMCLSSRRLGRIVRSFVKVMIESCWVAIAALISLTLGIPFDLSLQLVLALKEVGEYLLCNRPTAPPTERDESLEFCPEAAEPIVVQHESTPPKPPPCPDVELLVVAWPKMKPHIRQAIATLAMETVAPDGDDSISDSDNHRES